METSTALADTSKPIITIFSDPGCPYGYSASPDLHLLGWRYAHGVDFRLRMIGLADTPAVYENKGLTPLLVGKHGVTMRNRYGMPFSSHVKSRIWGTGTACRAVIATGIASPGLEWQALRALQFTQFTTSNLIDEESTVREALATVTGLDVDAVVGAIDSPEVTARYEADREAARSAAGSAAELQGKTAADGDLVRYTAPTLILEDVDNRLIAGGMQSIEVYDAVVANSTNAPEPHPDPDGPLDALARFPYGLTTREVAMLLAGRTDQIDTEKTERQLVALTADGSVIRTPLGNDALWTVA